MIPIIEDSISALLSDSFTYLSKNSAKVSTILRMNESKRKELETYLSTHTVKIKRGYPRTNAELPCVCILLSGENEAQEGIGEYLDDTGSIVSAFKEELTVELGHSPYIQLSKFPVASITSVCNVDLGIYYSTEDLDLSELTKGIIKLPYPSEEGDTISVEYSYMEASISDMYTQFESNYRIEVWTQNADLTVQLYYLVKWALMVGRDRLHSEVGLYRQRIGGSDFQPAPSFFPDFVYRRALTFWCQLTESAPVQEIQYISKIEVNKTIDFDTQLGGGETDG